MTTRTLLLDVLRLFSFEEFAKCGSEGMKHLKITLELLGCHCVDVGSASLVMTLCNRNR